MKTVLLTGSQGFIGSYLCAELLKNNYQVVGVDNYSKYGYVKRAHDSNPNFQLIVKDVIDLKDSDIPKIDYIIACAAMIGGISYFHKYAYDLLATNERILASTFDIAIKRFQAKELERIVVLSSSMVFENAKNYPTKESDIEISPPPFSTYGFQKLSSEYFCKGAYEQYGLPYTILRPFNCVGVGEEEHGDKVVIGNVKMMMSHVLPDLIKRAIEIGPNAPLTILGSGDQIRHYTDGKDLARGIRIAMESDKAINNDFNLSTDRSTSVKELAEIIWKELYGNAPLTLSSIEGFKYDVQCRIPDTTKASTVLGFKCERTLEESVREVIAWIKG